MESKIDDTPNLIETPNPITVSLLTLGRNSRIRRASGFALSIAAFSIARAAVLPILPAVPPPQPTTHLNVLNFGAKGDGTTLDTVAFQKSLDAARTTPGGAVVDVPGTRSYLVGSILLPSNTWLNLQSGATLQGSNNPSDYPLVTERWEGHDVSCHRGLIAADQATNIAIIGSGTINAGSTVGRLRNPRGPALVEPRHVQGILVENVTLKQHGVWTLHPTFCQDVTLSGITFNTDGPNSDGIDPDSCARVLIDHCTFSDQDDNIAIKSGKGKEGATVGEPTTDVTISNNTFITGLACVTCGSECSGGIARVLLRNNTFGKGRAGLYFKSAEGRGGYYTDITADSNTYASQVLEINTSYTYSPDPNGVPGLPGVTRFNNISITNARVNSTTDLVKMSGDSKMPVNNLIFSHWSGNASSGIVIQNATNVSIDTATISVGGASPLTTESNVTSGLTVSPSTVTVVPGASANFSLASTALNGATALQVAGDGIVDGLPAGTTASFSPTSINGSSGIATLKLSTSNSTPPGTYPIVIQATAGAMAHTAAVSLVVAPLPNGIYQIVNRKSGKALSVPLVVSPNGTPVDQRTYVKGNPNQQWSITALGGGEFSIVGVGSGNFLEVSGNSLADGANIDIFTSNGGKNQRWIFTPTTQGYSTITSVNSGKVVDDAANSISEGAKVIQWPLNNGNNQQWIFESP